MFLGNLGHHSPVRRSSRPNVSVLTSRACASSRIGGITQLRVHPPFIIDSAILFVFLLIVEHKDIWYKLLLYRVITKEMNFPKIPCMVWVAVVSIARACLVNKGKLRNEGVADRSMYLQNICTSVGNFFDR